MDACVDVFVYFIYELIFFFFSCFGLPTGCSIIILKLFNLSLKSLQNFSLDTTCDFLSFYGLLSV